MQIAEHRKSKPINEIAKTSKINKHFKESDGIDKIPFGVDGGLRRFRK
jgi:hypothetical protein